MKKYILSLLVAVGLIGNASAQAPSGDLANGLVGFWALNGTTQDSSSFNNTGTGYDLRLASDRFGNANSAYYFDGTSSYIDLGNQPQYNFGASNFTLSSWVLSGPKQIDFTTYIIGKYTAPAPSSYGLGTAVTAPDVYAYSFLNDINSLERTVTSFQSIQNKQWHSVIATYERNSNLTVYIDGVLGGTTDISMLQGEQSNTTSLVIGGINSNSIFGPQLFEGCISDVGIWNTALSSSQVSQLYTIQSVPEPSAYALFAFGTIGMLMVMRRKKTA